MSALDFSPNRLKEWLSALPQANSADERFDISAMRGGASCDMFDLNWQGKRYALRRAPLTAVSDTAHNVVREYQVISALQDSAARIPTLLAVSEDRDIIGAPFYIMEFVDGEVIRKRLPQTYQADPAGQTNIGEELIDALVELHQFDWRNSAMTELAKPDNFLERQVSRWMHQLDGYRSRDLAGIDSVAKWLDDNRPEHGDLTVLHGDYKTDNALFSKSSPPRILTLVDFEMTTVGDPLIDLAWAMIFWPEPDNLIAIAAPGAEGGMHSDYCQTPETLIARYAQSTGRDISNLQWYQAFAAWKLAIVLEGSYAKFLAGKSTNPNHEFLGFVIDELSKRALRFAV